MCLYSKYFGPFFINLALFTSLAINFGTLDVKLLDFDFTIKIEKLVS